MTASGGNSTFAGADGGNAAAITVTTMLAVHPRHHLDYFSGGDPGNGANTGAGNNITFNTTLGAGTVPWAAGLSTISTGTTAGNILFDVALRSTNNEPLTLTSGTGNIFSVEQLVLVVVDPLGKVTISNANNVTTGVFTATELAQTVLGAGEFTNAGLITTTTGGARIQSRIVDLDAGITAAGQSVDMIQPAVFLLLMVATLSPVGTNQAAGSINGTTGGNIVLAGDLTAVGANRTGGNGAGLAGGAVTLGTTGAGTITLSNTNTDITTTGGNAAGAGNGGVGGAVNIDTVNTTISLTDTIISTAGGTNAGGGSAAGGAVTIGDTAATDDLNLAGLVPSMLVQLVPISLSMLLWMAPEH